MDDLGNVTVRLADGTEETYEAAELLANGVLKVSKTATPAIEGSPDSVVNDIEVAYYSPHAWIKVTPSIEQQGATKRGQYL
jgi:hypothetical protein